MASHTCRIALIAAPASGQGKTTLTAALAMRAHLAGERVRVFKCGPDFLDPMILAHASGAPVYNLDLFMGGLPHCQALIAQAAAQADLILIEGVMGLFDGTPSAATLAEQLDVPVLCVIDAGAMAQTFGAIAYGMRHFRPGLKFAGVFANHVGSAYHARLLEQALPSDIPWLGWMSKEAAISLPERHLGLLPAAEIDALHSRLAHAAHALQGLQLAWPVQTFPQPEAAPLARRLAGRRIAVARDAAFCFIYQANLDTLQALGAELKFFSPVAGEPLPDCDAVWLPGGYPELHADAIAANTGLRQALAAHHEQGYPILAECGGMMSLFERIVLSDGSEHAGLGLLPGATRMQSRLAALGLQQASLPEGRLRGHSFHYSSCETVLAPIARAESPPGGGNCCEAIYRLKRLTASYVHFYFPSNPDAVASLLL